MTPFVTTVIGWMRHHRGPVDGRTLCGYVISEPHPGSAAYGRKIMELPLCRKCQRAAARR